MPIDVKQSWKLLKKNLRPWPEGEKGLAVRDHRKMVGGAWEEIGTLQFEYLVQKGLEPYHVLLDIGCGSFRAGRKFIKYLEPGNYLGIHKQRELLREGRKHEVGEEMWKDKRPEIVVSDSFDFSRFSKRPDFAIAQSLYTHLGAKDIKKSLVNLAAFAPPHCKLYATFFEAERRVWNALSSQSSRRFEYTADQMRQLGRDCGWDMNYIGDWNHPRGQRIVEYNNPAHIP